MDLLAEIERPNPADEEKRERRFRLVASVGIVGLSLIGVSTLATGALFTDEDTVAGTITAGTVDIASTGNLDVTVALNGGFAPGDSITRAIAVDNGGSLELHYGTTAGKTGPLAPALVVTGASVGSTGTCDASTTLAPLPTAADTTLAAGDGDVFCVRIAFTDTGMPAGSLAAAAGSGDNQYQGDTADVTFTFTAVQRAGIAG